MLEIDFILQLILIFCYLSCLLVYQKDWIFLFLEKNSTLLEDWEIKMRKKIKKVVVAMSGGVDSSVAATLLKKQGFKVIGIFMKFWSEPRSGSTLINVDSGDDLRSVENRCCSAEAEVRARKVAAILDIPFYVFNFEKEFKKRVVDYFLKGYKKGITPNPCVVCNKEIKFGLLLEKALALGADYVATGHYARKIQNSKFKIQNDLERIALRSYSAKSNAKCKIFKLLRAKDKKKDQSYFLWQLNQKQLKHILFPIGNYTKNQVRNLAKKFKLPVLDVPESMEICFIPDNNLNRFLKSQIKINKGKIITTEGKIIGEHQGLHFYTIGQRKGIELSGGPFYVVDKDLKRNALIVTSFLTEKNLYSKSLIVKNVNWISGQQPKLPLKIKAQIRYGHKVVSATIDSKIQNQKYKILFIRPQRAVTPGQSAVFYQGQELLGGGIILEKIE